MSDVVTLVKSNGESSGNVKALIQRELILIEDVSLPIEEGDLLLRQLPNGLTEKYVVIDRGFMSGVAGKDPHYQVKVRKEGVTKENTTSISYNLSGAHSRVNINSQDSSINVSSTTTDNVFADMRQVIHNQVNDGEVQLALLDKLARMEELKGTRSFTEAYRDFLALAADYMSVLAPFLPALSQWLVS